MSFEKTPTKEKVVVQGGSIDNAVQLAEDVANQQYSKWTPSMFRLYGCLSIAYLCGCLNGVCGLFPVMRHLLSISLTFDKYLV